jgi:hypothetical protein
MPSDLPSFPGASHLYHVGATGSFLDYSAALKLTADQQAALKRIKEESMGDLAAAQCRIDQAEQELWMITDSDRPDSMTTSAPHCSAPAHPGRRKWPLRKVRLAPRTRKQEWGSTAPRQE